MTTSQYFNTNKELLISTLKIVGLKDIPAADQAVVFTLGLNKGFESLLVHLSNMQTMGTDQYEKAEPAGSFLLFFHLVATLAALVRSFSY